MGKECRNVSHATVNCVGICQWENEFSPCHRPTQFHLGIYDFRTLSHSKRLKITIAAYAIGLAVVESYVLMCFCPIIRKRFFLPLVVRMTKPPAWEIKTIKSRHAGLPLQENKEQNVVTARSHDKRKEIENHPT